MAFRAGQKVFHSTHGFCTVTGKDGMMRVKVQKDLPPVPDLEGYDESPGDNKLSVRTDQLQLVSEMEDYEKEAAMKEHEELKAKRQEKMARLQIWRKWRDSLPEIPIAVKEQLQQCCKDGIMTFLTFLDSDPDAINK